MMTDTTTDLTNENTQYQLGASLNQSHIRDTSVHTAINLINGNNVNQLGTTVNQGHVCDDSDQSTP